MEKQDILDDLLDILVWSANFFNGKPNPVSQPEELVNETPDSITTNVVEEQNTEWDWSQVVEPPKVTDPQNPEYHPEFDFDLDPVDTATTNIIQTPGEVANNFLREQSFARQEELFIDPPEIDPVNDEITGESKNERSFIDDEFSSFNRSIIWPDSNDDYVLPPSQQDDSRELIDAIDDLKLAVEDLTKVINEKSNFGSSVSVDRRHAPRIGEI